MKSFFSKFSSVFGNNRIIVVNKTTSNIKTVDQNESVDSSNIRKFELNINADSQVEVNYKTYWKHTMDWCHEYWQNHNNLYLKEKLEFIENHKDGDIELFNKLFLEKNKSKHLKFNKEWYGRIFKVIVLGCKSELYKISQIIRKDK